METKFIEATQDKANGFNWGKFMLGRFSETEWAYASRMCGSPLLHARGWGPNNLLVLDLETGEGSVFLPGGLASADLNKHQIRVCPMYEPFLEWLYTQDLSNLSNLPDVVELPKAPADMYGYRRPGPKKSKKTTT